MTKHHRRGATLIQEVNRTEVPFGTLAIWFLGQESVIIKGDGVTVYVDPYVSDHLDLPRTYPAPITPEDIIGADLCLITHEHVDHMDAGTLPIFHRQNKEALVMAPACCKPDLIEMGVGASQILEADDSRSAELFSKIKITTIPAAHEELDKDAEGKPRYVGYVIELNGVTLYHAGDTVLFPELVERLSAIQPDVALLPINGADFFRRERGIVGNMNYREAAEFAVRIGAETVIPLHYDVFAGNAEKPGHFVNYLYEHFPEQKCHVMARGERYVYVKGSAFLL
ncbi:MBL fold metallo-hydrolase [Paenibacillus ihumii]|uniref:MBL fold metallo-hydrolase n=1 Tax=Paenibacillus ihumii TaxID=687436 RepID=UPI0006D85580|nr:MBL fold metallo-hydrolase [Paenibacillus ihumii]